MHLVLDDASTHESPAIQRWLAGHPRFALHLSPISLSWLNLVEQRFAELTTKKLRRGAHRSTRLAYDGGRSYAFVKRIGRLFNPPTQCACLNVGSPASSIDEGAG